MKSGSYHLVEFVNPSGATVFRIDGKDPEGERIRKNFKTRLEAQAELQRLELAAQNVTAAAPLRSTRLTDHQLAEAEAVYKKLAGRSLTEAADFFLANWREPVTRKSLGEAMEDFLADKAKQNLRKTSLQNLRAKALLLVSSRQETPFDEITVDTLKGIITRPKTSPQTQKNVRRGLHTFYEWAKGRGYVAENLVAKIPTPEMDEAEPEVLPLPEVRKLLAAAVAFKDGTLVPYVALSLFAGIRPTELARLSWDDIDLEEGSVTIGPAIAKMRQRRIVEFVRLQNPKTKKVLSANLIDWLTPHAIRKTPFVAPNWTKDFNAVKEAAGFGTEANPWVPDVMRHTAISFHLAHLEHEGKTALWAGNSPQVIQKHYRNLVKSKDAAEFWDIRPKNLAAKIVPLPIAAAAG